MEDSGPSWRRAHARLLSIVAAVLLLYALAGFLLAPRLARNAIIQYVHKDLGRQASIGKLSFNPFSLVIEIHQFELREADDRPIASFDLLRVGASLMASLFNRAWTLSEVRLEQPVVQVQINRDGSLNLAKLAPPEQKPEPPAGELPAVRVKALGVHGGSVHFEDLSRGEPFGTTLAPIEFDLTDFRTAPKFQNNYRFSAQSDAGERLEWAGQFTVRPLGSTGQFTVSALKAATIADYLQDALPCALTSGSLDVQGSYQFIASPTASLSLTLPSIKVHSLGIAARSSVQVPWITLPELDVANTSVSLDQRQVAIGAVTLQRAALQLWRNADGSLNLQQLMAPAGTPPASIPAATTPAASAPWRLALDKLELQDADIEAEDRSVNPAVKMHLRAIALTLQNYSSAGSAPLTFDLHLGLGDTGKLQTQGTVALASLNTALDLSLSDVDLPALQPYLSQSTQLTLYRGRLGLKGHVAYAQSPARGQPQLALALAVDVSDLATRDNVTNEDLVSWRSLRIDGLRYQMAPAALSIERIVAGAPYGRVIIGAKGGLNLSDIMRPTAAQAAAQQAARQAASEAAATPVAQAKRKGRARVANSGAGTRTVSTATISKPAAAPMPMRIARIDIQDGTADFTDHSVMPNFSTAIYALKGSVLGLSSEPSSRAAVSLEGSVDRYAPVSIKGQVNVLSAAAYTDITMSFSNIELPTFNPYSGKFAGYNIAQGKLSTLFQYHVENRTLDAKHHIVVDQLEFGAATESKQAVPLPIKLAVSLLKDRNGVITLDLPVGGSLDDPTFRVGPLVWKLFVGLITKIVTAPFALLGSLFGGGPELSFIDFPAGAATLTPAQLQKLTQLSGALVERPQLKLDIPLHTQGDDDDAALERARLEEALHTVAAPASAKRARPATPAPAAATAAPAAGVTTDAARLPALAALYRAQFHADPEYPPETAAGANADGDRAAWLENQLLPQFAPSPTQRDALSQARAQAVQAAVLANTELKPERVFLTNQVSGGGPDGFVRMELKLE
jgi:Domain of Unknown Function (DUF748)